MSTSSEPTSGEPPLIECDLPLGKPGLVVHNRLLLSGWAASPNGVTGVVVNIDDRMWTAGYGLDTPSVAERLPDVDGAERAGYRLEIDTSGWTPGPRYVAVAAYCPDGRRSTVEGPIDVQPIAPLDQGSSPGAAALEDREVTLTLDSPAIEAGEAEVEGALEVRGWAHAKGGVDAVLVTLDGIIQYEALRPISRPDLLRELGSDAAAEAGFSLVIDPVDCPPGRHSLTVAALPRDGRAAGVECELTCRPAPGPTSAATASDGEAGAAPRLRDDDDDAASAGEQRDWEDRALLAEADAALSRAEARLSQAGQERAMRELRKAESDPAAPAARIRGELGEARQSLVSLREEIAESVERERLARHDAEEREGELAALREELETARHESSAVQRQLSETRYELEATSGELRATREELEGTSGELHATRDELEGTRDALRATGEDLKHRAALLDSVEHSASWRLTRPLRAMKGLFRGGSTA